MTLWDFACELYGRDGVSAALLPLQDEHGLNIPFLLFCLWRGCAVGELTAEEMVSARALADAELENLVLPRRQLRRSLDKSDARYEQARQSELAMEQRLLMGLAAQWGWSAMPLPRGAGPAVANARTYLAAAGIPRTDDNEQRLALVLRQLPI